MLVHKEVQTHFVSLHLKNTVVMVKLTVPKNVTMVQMVTYEMDVTMHVRLPTMVSVEVLVLTSMILIITVML